MLKVENMQKKNNSFKSQSSYTDNTTLEVLLKYIYFFLCTIISQFYLLLEWKWNLISDVQSGQIWR